jgi:hypothetical protein
MVIVELDELLRCDIWSKDTVFSISSCVGNIRGSENLFGFNLRRMDEPDEYLCINIGLAVTPDDDPTELSVGATRDRIECVSSECVCEAIERPLREFDSSSTVEKPV